MFIAMNRFRVKKGSESDFESVWLTATRISTRCRASWNSIFSRVRRRRTTRSIPPIPCGKARRHSRPGPSRRHSAGRIRAPAATSRSISNIPSSRASRCARRSRLPSRPLLERQFALPLFELGIALTIPQLRQRKVIAACVQCVRRPIRSVGGTHVDRWQDDRRHGDHRDDDSASHRHTLATTTAFLVRPRGRSGIRLVSSSAKTR